MSELVLKISKTNPDRMFFKYTISRVFSFFFLFFVILLYFLMLYNRVLVDKKCLDLMKALHFYLKIYKRGIRLKCYMYLLHVNVI